MLRKVVYKCGCEAAGHNVAEYCMMCGDGILKETVETPHGSVTLEAPTEEAKQWAVKAILNKEK